MFYVRYVGYIFSLFPHSHSFLTFFLLSNISSSNSHKLIHSLPSSLSNSFLFLSIDEVTFLSHPFPLLSSREGEEFGKEGEKKCWTNTSLINLTPLFDSLSLPNVSLRWTFLILFHVSLLLDTFHGTFHPPSSIFLSPLWSSSVYSEEGREKREKFNKILSLTSAPFNIPLILHLPLEVFTFLLLISVYPRGMANLEPIFLPLSISVFDPFKGWTERKPEMERKRGRR